MELKETHTNEPREVRHGSTGRQEAEVKKKKSRIQDWPGLQSEILFQKQNHKNSIKQRHCYHLLIKPIWYTDHTKINQKRQGMSSVVAHAFKSQHLGGRAGESVTFRSAWVNSEFQDS